MATPFGHPSFAAGEIAASVQGRIDLAKYHIGLQTCLNWFIHPYGGASTRNGFSFVGEAIDHSLRSRLVPFQFRTAPSGQNYILEFSHAKMRIVKDGAYVLDTASVISNVTQGNPAIVTTVGAHGLTNGDQIWLVGILGMTQLNYRRATITVTGANTAQIDIDTTTFNAYTGSGIYGRFCTIVSPYDVADLPLLKFVQDKDTMTLTHPLYETRDLTRSSHTAWTFTIRTFAPTILPPTALTSSVAGALVWGVTSVRDTEEESLPSATITGAFNSTIGWTLAANAIRYRIYQQKNGIFGFVGESTVASFLDPAAAGTIPDYADSAPIARNPFVGAGNYAGCTGYHDGRQWFARSNNGPQTFWGSQSASSNNMSVSDPVRDSDAITRTINTREVNEIRHIVSMTQMILLTSGGTFKVWPGSQTDFLTPGACNVRLQNNEGASDVPPVITKDAMVYFSNSGKKFLDVTYDFSSDSWPAREMTILASHIYKKYPLEEASYSKDPNSVIWGVRSDGMLTGFTYLREHDVYAHHRHVTEGIVESVASVREGNETVLYISVVRQINGVQKRYVERQATRIVDQIEDFYGVDAGVEYDGWNKFTGLYMKVTGATYGSGDVVTLQALGHAPFTAASVGKYYILRANKGEDSESTATVLITAFTDTDTVTGTLALDAYATLQDIYVSDWALAITEMEQLWHLTAKKIAMLLDGNVPDEMPTVANGKVTLPRPCGRVIAGLGYICDLETLDPEFSTEGFVTLQGRKMAVNEVVMRVENTRGLKVGPDFDRLAEVKERTTEAFGSPTRLQTDDQHITIEQDWESNGHICIRQQYPLPATINGIFPRVTIGDE